MPMSAPLATKGGDLASTLKLPPVPASEMLVRLDKGRQPQKYGIGLKKGDTELGEAIQKVLMEGV